MVSPFDLPPPPDAHPAFLNMRAATGGHAAAAKQAVEAMWLAYRGRATNHWLSQFPRSTHDRFWEMYLALALEADGLRLAPRGSVRRDKGPDVVVLRDGELPVVLEAVCATLGAPGNPNSVLSHPPSTPDNIRVRKYPEEQVVLRMATALASKAKQRDEHIEAGFIHPSSPFVIGLNDGASSELSLGSLQPMALKALFPVGHPFLAIDRHTLATTDNGWTTRPLIKKVPARPGAGGAPVATTMFASAEFAGVSAVLCSSANVANHAWIGLQPGRSGFVLVRNPYATHPVPPDVLPVDEVIDAVPTGNECLELRRQPGRAPVLDLPRAVSGH